MDLKENEARNDYLTDRWTNQSEVNVRWSPACEDMSPGEEEHPLLEEVTRQCNDDCD
jgi:hypothetical protein